MPSITWLERTLFAPFGDVIEASDAVHHYPINAGCTERYHDLASLDLLNLDGRAGVSLFRSSPQTLPFTVKLLERHPLSSQLFMPLGRQPWLVVVAPAGPLDENAIAVFLARPDQGVNFHAGTWHHFSLALFETSDFLVVDRIGPGDNCDEVALASPFTIEAEAVDRLLQTGKADS